MYVCMYVYCFNRAGRARVVHRFGRDVQDAHTPICTQNGGGQPPPQVRPQSPRGDVINDAATR